MLKADCCFRSKVIRQEILHISYSRSLHCVKHSKCRHYVAVDSDESGRQRGQDIWNSGRRHMLWPMVMLTYSVKELTITSSCTKKINHRAVFRHFVWVCGGVCVGVCVCEGGGANCRLQKNWRALPSQKTHHFWPICKLHVLSFWLIFLILLFIFFFLDFLKIFFWMWLPHSLINVLFNTHTKKKSKKLIILNPKHFLKVRNGMVKLTSSLRLIILTISFQIGFTTSHSQYLQDVYHRSNNLEKHWDFEIYYLSWYES